MVTRDSLGGWQTWRRRYRRNVLAANKNSFAGVLSRIYLFF